METSQESQLKSQHSKQQRTSDLDPASYNFFHSYTHKYNLEAVESVHFRRPTRSHYQHLDVGCGPADFLAEHLVPRLRPFQRVVGADNSSEMLGYARSHYQFPEVSFELLDIEHGDARAIIDKCGTFDRVYSFLTFQYVWNLEKAYRNIHRLLKEGGECLVVYYTRTGFSDVWHKLYQDEEWKRCMPDLGAMVAERFCINQPVPGQEFIELESRAVKAAGLEMVACRTFTHIWTFPNKDECLGAFLMAVKLISAPIWSRVRRMRSLSFPSRADDYREKNSAVGRVKNIKRTVMKNAFMRCFKLDAKVPPERRSAFRGAWMSALLEESDKRALGSGIALVYEYILAHAQRPEFPS